MCGIVGYVGLHDGTEMLINGLRRLEYRGYDSAGIAMYDGEKVALRKAKGRLAMLEAQMKANPIAGNTGIGHTRWATHGEPNDINAHPHTDMKGNIAIVHNGIIENYYALKKGLEAQGVVFRSQTDTEVIVQLLGHYYHGDMQETLNRVLPMLEGSFALAVLDGEQPDKLYATRKNSPLVIACCEGGHYVASDIPALLEYSRDIVFLDDMEIAVLNAEDAYFFDEFGNALHKEKTHIDWDISAAEKGGYAHYMLKEIFEEPEVLQKTLEHYVIFSEKPCLKEQEMPLDATQVQAISRVRILACGTAYHAGMLGRDLIEKIARIPVSIDIASEYRYRDTPILPNEACIIISQSGETADTIAAMRKARAANAPCVALCNVIGSTITREADAVMYTLAGPEIAVASTKAYIAQVMTVILLALDWGHKRGALSAERLQEALCELKSIPTKAAQLLETDVVADIQHLASRVFDCKSVFFIGRGLDYATALEAALKLKEISYIHSESYAAGELKHGTIALIEKGTVVVAMATQKQLRDKMASNIEEVRVRGARILVIAPVSGATQELKAKGDVWTIPDGWDEFAPLLSIIPMQLFAYFMALQKGCDIDKPRNLAKSVTVE